MDNKDHPLKATCAICSKEYDEDKLLDLQYIRDHIWETILTKKSQLTREGYICKKDYQKYKILNLNNIIERDIGEISKLEQDVIKSISTQELLSENANEAYEDTLTFGEKIADKISTFGGSWKFIFIFFGVLVGWMFLNSMILMSDAYDPYPYILLNLVLSCLAAIQAPIIMMSQNRRGERERIQAENDYKVNLKSELQIRQLHSKLDKFTTSQWQTLLKTQQIQTDLMHELTKIRAP